MCSCVHVELFYCLFSFFFLLCVLTVERQVFGCLRFRCSGVQVQVFRCSAIQVFSYSGVQGFRGSGVQVFKCSSVQVFMCSGV